MITMMTNDDLSPSLLLSLCLLLHLLEAGPHVVRQLLDLGHQVVHLLLVLLVHHWTVNDLTLQLLDFADLDVDLLAVVPDFLHLLEEVLERTLVVFLHVHVEIVPFLDVGILLHGSQSVLGRRHLDPSWS